MAYTMIAAYHPSSTQPGERRLATIALVGLLLLGLILRLVVTFAFPSINSPDEICQTVEQALRLTTGVGIAAEPEGVISDTILPATMYWVLPGGLSD